MKSTSESKKSIPFPKDEHKDIEDRLLNNKQVTTVRVESNLNKFKPGDVLKTFNNHEIVVTNVERIGDIKSYKFYSFLSNDQKKYLSKYNQLDIVDFKLYN